MKIILSILMCILVSCVSNDIYRYYEYDFSKSQEYNFDVKKVRFENLYTQSFAYPNVAHKAPTPLPKALDKWARNNIHTVGNDKYLKIVVMDATVTERPLKQDNSFFAQFVREPDVEYRAVLEVRFEVYDNENVVPISTMDLKVDRDQTGSRHDSPAEKEKLLYNLTKTVIFDFITHVDQNIYDYLGKYLR